MRYTGRKGWQASYKDTWSLDYTLSPIILAGLKKFKETERHGLPALLCDKHDDIEDRDERERVISEEWEAILDAMIYAFDDDARPNYKDYNYNVIMSEQPNGYFTLDSDNKEEEERYSKDMRLWEEKKQEGLNLFAEFYTALWD